LRVGVFDDAWNVGDADGVSSTLGAVTTVSFVADGGSLGSLASTAAVVTAGGCCFILALVLVGGIYT